MLNNRKDITKNGYLEDTTDTKHSSKGKIVNMKKKKVKKFQHLPNRNSKKKE